ncbi:MAG: hypothetical protein ACJAR3_002902 [Roseivirga sp.]|jgi:hypothetical protein
MSSLLAFAKLRHSEEGRWPMAGGGFITPLYHKSQKTFQFHIFLYLCISSRVFEIRNGFKIKRESGVNPGQSQLL